MCIHLQTRGHMSSSETSNKQTSTIVSGTLGTSLLQLQSTQPISTSPVGFRVLLSVPMSKGVKPQLTKPSNNYSRIFIFRLDILSRPQK